MNFRKTAISGIKWTSVGTIGRALFQLLQVSILTRFLPKEAFGLVSMALFVVQFSNIFVDMGMTSAILHRQNATKNEYSSIYWLNIFISLFLYGILFFGAPVVARFYDEPELRMLVPILGTNLVLMASGRQHRTIMQKQFQFKAIAITELISFFLGLIAATLLAINGFGVYSLVYSTLLASFISNGLFLIQNQRLNPIRFHFRLKETKPFLRIGGFTMGSTLLDFFSREMDILIIGKLLGAESLGVYSLAKQIVLKLYSIVNPIILNVLSPILSSIQKEKEKVKQYYLKAVHLLASINIPIYLLIIVLSKEILTFVYGQDYASGFMVLSFIAVSYGINTIGNPVGSLQIATGRTDIGFKWTILRVIITPPVIFAGALINIEAVAAFYALLSLFIIIPLWFIQLKPMANISLKEYTSQFYKPLIFFLAATLLIYFSGEKAEIKHSIIVNAILKVAVTLIAFGIFILFFDKKSVLETYNLFISTIKRKK
ncbi:MOP flippase family protein [Anaerophaga thermohalophila]|uniref:MOP flippase family protein n=1 Tax=Anaerophaga thermohalophila TaxID=177400 RepID=UPI0002DE29A4|nr:MOP flippase family protein [Anaerophaga thermohalophila]